MIKNCIGSLTACLLSVGIAEAVPVTFFGEDPGLGETTRLSAHSNADAARASFFSNLVGVGTQTFESFPANQGTPLSVTFPGAGTASLEGQGTGGGVTASVPSGTNGAGRYPISGNIYWEVSSSNFHIQFGSRVAAFGFYGVDIGDFNGQLTLSIERGGAPPTPFTVPHTIDGPGGSVLYFGVIDTENPFEKIIFGNTAGGVDFFGFDDFSIASVEQVQQIPLAPTPEPGSLLLLGSSLAGTVAAAWKRRKAARLRSNA